MTERLLAGATVQKVFASASLVILRLREPGETTHLVIAGVSRGLAVGASVERPFAGSPLPGEPVPEQVKRLRQKLEGGAIEVVAERLVVVSRADERHTLEVQRDARIVLRPTAEADAQGALSETETERRTLLHSGLTLTTALGANAALDRKAAAKKAFARAMARIARRTEAIRTDLGRIAEAQDLAVKAASFVAEAARAPRGARALRVTDWSSGEARELELALDPARGAREQLDAIFKRARRLKQGSLVARQRLLATESLGAKLTVLSEALATAEELDALELLVKQAKTAAPRDFSLSQGPSKGGGSKKNQPPAPPFRTFLSERGERILVGRGAAHNDVLTFKVARPHDLWLHAKGYPGAHVVVPLEKNSPPTSELLVEAAHLAAHFSDAREEPVTEVRHALRKYLKKPRGSPAGLVVALREKVIHLRVDRALLARLLAREES